MTTLKNLLRTLFGYDVLVTVLGLAGAAAIEIAAALDALPASQGQGWHYAALAVAALGRFLERRAIVEKTKAAAKIAAALVLCLGLARADEAAAKSPTTLCFDEACSVSLAPGLAFSGSAYDFETKTIVRSVQFSGLAEIRWDKIPVGLALGVAFQTGDMQGLTATQFLTFPTLPGTLKDLALGAHETFVGEKPSVVLAAGYLVRF